MSTPVVPASLPPPPPRRKSIVNIGESPPAFVPPKAADEDLGTSIPVPGPDERPVVSTSPDLPSSADHVAPLPGSSLTPALSLWPRIGSSLDSQAPLPGTEPADLPITDPRLLVALSAMNKLKQGIISQSEYDTIVEQNKILYDAAAKAELVVRVEKGLKEVRHLHDVSA